jgi:hypothetical protein
MAIDVLSQRTRTEPPCHIQIVVPGRVTEADTPDAFETEIDIRDLTLIRTIRVEVGAKRGTRVTIHVEREPPAMTVEVSGEDRTRVEGIISQLDDLLRRGAQRLTKRTIEGILVLSAFALPIGVAGAIQLIEGNPRTYSTTGSVVAVSAVLVAVGMAAGGIWLFPSLELLQPGTQTRVRRFRLAIVAFVASIVSSLAAGLIYDVVK